MLKKAFLLRADEAAFVEDMALRFPRLREAFDTLICLTPQERLSWARARLDKLPRTGYVLRGVPANDVETVGAHVEHAKALAAQWTPQGYDTALVIAMIDIHDIGEGVIGDFTIHDDITRAEKGRLEEIAVRLIFEEDPGGLHDIWKAFEYKSVPEAAIAHDIEKAQVLFKAIEYETKYPFLCYRFDDFWDNLADMWSSPVGPQIHEHTAALRSRLPGPAKPLFRYS